MKITIRTSAAAVGGRRGGAMAALVAWALFLFLGIAQAQEVTEPAPSRGELLTAERQAKAETPAEPDRSFVERKLYWYDNQHVVQQLLAGWHGIHFAGGDFPAGAGFTVGVGFTERAVGSIYEDADQSNRVDLNFSAATSTRGYGQIAGSVAWLNVAGAPFDLAGRARVSELPEEDFFGFGPASRETDRTTYRLDMFEGGLDLAWQATRAVQLGTGVTYLNPRVGQGEDSRFPSADDVFRRRALPGFEARPDFVRVDGRIAYNWLDNPLDPRSGGLYRVQFFDFRDQDLGQFDFRRLEAGVYQYVPLPATHRGLALRAEAVLTDIDADQAVPFYFQPTLGGHQRLRGFREFRFRDRNSLLLTAEYRWQAWWALDGALFADAGKVAFERSDVDLHDLEFSYGFGLRMHSNSAFVGRLDFAFSREGFIPFLRFTHVF